MQYSLHSEFVRSHRDAVYKLHGAPEAVELHAFVHMHHTITGQWPTPDGVIQEASHTYEDDLKHGQAAAQPLLGQQVTFTGNGYLLEKCKTGDK